MVGGVIDSLRLASFFPGLSMGLCDWEERSVELASYLVDQVSGNLSSHRMYNEDNLRSLRYVAGVSRGEKVMRAVGPGKPSGVTQRAVMNSRT